MIRRFFFALIFGTMVGFYASQQSGLAAGIVTGMLSACGFWVASVFVRGRVLKRQGEVPSMNPGEKALLFGPCEVSDSQGSSKAWVYLSNQRLLLRSEEGEGSVDLKLKDIEELRPHKAGVIVVSKAHGMLKLKLPNPKRWMEALRLAVRV